MIAFLVLCLFGAVSSQSSDPCWRQCDGVPLTCTYNFTIEYYLTLSKACHDCPFNTTHCSRPHCVSGDGQRRAIIAVNKQMPAPDIRVCKNDRIIANVYNELESGEGTSIHWHGIDQLGTPYMDGGSMLTQCPISQRAHFQYDFIAGETGTRFYHSHTGFQRSDGLYGAFIVNNIPSEDPHNSQYDHDCSSPDGHCEFIMQVTDFYTELGTARFAYWMHHAHDLSRPLSALINGKNQKYGMNQTRNSAYTYNKGRLHHNHEEQNAEPRQTAYTPYEVFQIEHGKKYRFRVISAANQILPFKISVDGHTLKVISADGNDVESIEVDTFCIYPGERYDFVLHANHPVANYWVKAHALIDGYPTRANAYAILRYTGAPEADPQEDRDEDRRGMFLNPALTNDGNPINSHGEPYDILVDQLNGINTGDFTSEQVGLKLYIAMDMNKNDQTRFHHPEYYPIDQLPSEKEHHTPVFDNITFKVPPVPFLSQPEDTDASWLCNASSVDQAACYDTACECVHALVIPLGQVVELIFVNEAVEESEGGHPIHIHGYDFRILGVDKVGQSTSKQQIQDMDNQGQLKRKLVNPSLRDTIVVHDGGYVVTRFVADNPGFWFLHCHSEMHVEQGQVMVLKVGDASDLPPKPANFPRCGDWPKDNTKRRPQQPLKKNAGSPKLHPLKKNANKSPKHHPDKLNKKMLNQKINTESKRHQKRKK